MEQLNIGDSQQVFIGVGGEMTSSNFNHEFTEISHRIFVETLSPTGVSFFGSAFYPASVRGFIRHVLKSNASANILLVHHILPKSLEFLMQDVVFFRDAVDDVYRGVYLSNKVLKNLDLDKVFTAIDSSQGLYQNLKSHLVLDYKISCHDEDADVIL
jgi:hypothetical protein